MEIKDKPNSMSVREWITKKVAQETVVPENVIKRVISHQFDSAYEALDFNNSVEISGFGKFYYNTKKANKEIEIFKKKKDSYRKFIEESVSENERYEAREKLKWVEDKLETLLKKKANYGKS